MKQIWQHFSESSAHLRGKPKRKNKNQVPWCRRIIFHFLNWMRKRGNIDIAIIHLRTSINHDVVAIYHYKTNRLLIKSYRWNLALTSSSQFNRHLYYIESEEVWSKMSFSSSHIHLNGSEIYVMFIHATFWWERHVRKVFTCVVYYILHACIENRLRLVMDVNKSLRWMPNPQMDSYSFMSQRQSE